MLFLYRDVLHQDLGDLGRVERAKRPERLPVVLTRGEVDRLLAGMTGTPAYVRNALMDILATNDLCAVLYDGILDEQNAQRKVLRL